MEGFITWAEIEAAARKAHTLIPLRKARELACTRVGLGPEMDRIVGLARMCEAIHPEAAWLVQTLGHLAGQYPTNPTLLREAIVNSPPSSYRAYYGCHMCNEFLRDYYTYNHEFLLNDGLTMEGVARIIRAGESNGFHLAWKLTRDERYLDIGCELSAIRSMFTKAKLLREGGELDASLQLACKAILLLEPAHEGVRMRAELRVLISHASHDFVAISNKTKYMLGKLFHRLDIKTTNDIRAYNNGNPEFPAHPTFISTHADPTIEFARNTFSHCKKQTALACNTWLACARRLDLCNKDVRRIVCKEIAESQEEALYEWLGDPRSWSPPKKIKVVR